MKKRGIFKLSIALLCLASVLLTGCSAMDGGNLAPGEGYIGNADDGYTQDKVDNNIPSVNDPNYGEIIENQFVKAEDEPTSTFSADVDTAAYSYFRKLVNSGYDLSTMKNISGGQFRTEEMLNYFKYETNAPQDGELFGVKAQIGNCPWNNEAALLMLNLKAKEAAPVAGNNLVFLIDVSGSMGSDDKLPLLKKAFSYLIAQLKENDTVSIVTYSGKEAVVLNGCSGSRGEQIQAAVDALKANGSTNGEAGLKMAYAVAEEHFIPGGNNRIIMASDGDLNVGISSEKELKSFVESKRDAGIYISVLGFGTGNYKDSKMETLADNGNGVYYYIDGETEAEKIFGDDLTATLLTVAEDVKLQLTFDPKYVLEYRLVGYENRLLNNEDFEDDTKDAGEVGSGHTVTVLYELKLADQPDIEEVQGPWMKLAIRYKDPGQDFSRLNEYDIGKESLVYDNPNTSFKFACAVAETSMLLRKSALLGDIGIDDILTTLTALELDDPLKLEFRELIKVLATTK